MGESTVMAGVRDQWSFQPNGPDFVPLSAWAAGPDEYYLAGYDHGSGAVYRGAR